MSGSPFSLYPQYRTKCGLRRAGDHCLFSQIQICRSMCLILSVNQECGLCRSFLCSPLHLLLWTHSPAASGTGIRLAEIVGDTKEFEIQGPAQHNKFSWCLGDPGFGKDWWTAHHACKGGSSGWSDRRTWRAPLDWSTTGYRGSLLDTPGLS